jgi:hypothetical protein
MGILPAFNISIFLLSTSTHVTVIPISARQAPETNPTYPVPITAIFIGKVLMIRSAKIEQIVLATLFKLLFL